MKFCRFMVIAVLDTAIFQEITQEIIGSSPIMTDGSRLIMTDGSSPIMTDGSSPIMTDGSRLIMTIN